MLGCIFASSLVVFPSYVGKKQRCFHLKIVKFKLFAIKVDCVYSMEIYKKTYVHALHMDILSSLFSEWWIRF